MQKCPSFFFSFSIWTLSCFSSLLISPVYSLSPGILSHPLFCLSPEERSVVLFLCSFSSNKQCALSQVSNSLHFKFLPCLKRMIVPFYLPPRASLRKIQWDDHSNGNGCHCWDFLYTKCIISIISLNTQDILYERHWLLHSTFLLTGRWRLQMVLWLIQDYTTEPVFRPRSLHGILIIRWPSLKCLKNAQCHNNTSYGSPTITHMAD